MQRTNWMQSVIDEAKTQPELKYVNEANLEKLYSYVRDEAEAWDGEMVTAEFVAKVMAARYKAVGLIASRN